MTAAFARAFVTAALILALVAMIGGVP